MNDVGSEAMSFNEWAQTLHNIYIAYLPLQVVLSVSNSYPFPQAQSNDPGLLIQMSSHPSLIEVHSSISEIYNLYNNTCADLQ